MPKKDMNTAPGLTAAGVAALEREGAGLTNDDVATIKSMQAVAEAEARAQANAVTPGKRQFILQEISFPQTRQYTVIRRRVQLTPSMCRARGCGYDAAKECGFLNGWTDPHLSHDQPLPDGRKLGEAILALLETHNATAHVIEQSHIIGEDELMGSKQWANVPAPFLTART